MTAGYGLAGAPSSGAIHVVAPGVYREVVAGSIACCSASYQGAFERLERSDGKLSRAVLRGRGGGNAALLPDHLRGGCKAGWKWDSASDEIRISPRRDETLN